MENKYLMLKQLAVLMALDIGLTAINCVCLFFPGTENFQTASLYIARTVMGLQLLLWSLIVVLLSHMTDLHKSFRKAGIWYLARIFAFIATTMLWGGVFHLYDSPHDSLLPENLFVFFSMVLLALGVTPFTEALFLSMGNRAVLLASSELLELFGMEEPARKNRRCGRRMMWFAAAYMFFFALAFAALLAAQRLQGNPALSGEGVPEALILLALVMAALCLPAWLGMEWFRILAAVSVHRAYRAIGELTR